jgi:hypothetical protein
MYRSIHYDYQLLFRYCVSKKHQYLSEFIVCDLLLRSDIGTHFLRLFPVVQMIVLDACREERKRRRYPLHFSVTCSGKDGWLPCTTSQNCILSSQVEWTYCTMHTMHLQCLSCALKKNFVLYIIYCILASFCILHMYMIWYVMFIKTKE